MLVVLVVMKGLGLLLALCVCVVYVGGVGEGGEGVRRSEMLSGGEKVINQPLPLLLQVPCRGGGVDGVSSGC